MSHPDIVDLTRADRQSNEELAKMKNPEPHDFERSEHDEHLCAHCGNGRNVTWHTS